MSTLELIQTDEPMWIQVLRQHRTQKGAKTVGEEIGYSQTVVSQVLNNKYPGVLAKVEKAVRGAYLGETVNCPVLGELAANRCLEEQKKPYRGTNRQAVQLYRACCRCENNQKNNSQGDV